MPLTLAILDSILVPRCGGTLALAGLDGVTVDGTNVALLDPIRQGLASLGIATATVGVVDDDDLLPITADTLDQLLDVAELRALESALGWLDQPDQMADTDNQQSLGKLRDSIETTVARRRKQVEKQYGYGAASLANITIDLGFQERYPIGEWGGYGR
jgi:hypothetical protein